MVRLRRADVGPAVAMLVLVGCSSERPKPVCDPLDPTAGRVALENRAPAGRLARGEAVLFDNGAYYVFVDGRCNYWAKAPNERWAETRTGVLDTEAAARIGEMLHFNAWDDLDGVWSGEGVFDAPTLIFDDATNALVCEQLCDTPNVPNAVKAIREAFPMIAAELWDRGQPVGSALRVIAVAREPASHIPFVDWPLARPITDFERTSENIEYGEGILEEDLASVQALRELRASFLRGDHGAFFWDGLPVTSGGAYYYLFFRDTLPFEDANGFVPLTGLGWP